MANQDDIRMDAALVVAIIGLLIPAILVVFLVLNNWKANDVGTVVAVFTGIVGTLVGSFLGVKVGSAGKEIERARADKTQDLANRALARLPPDVAKSLVG
jgi:hypothetical protein